MNITLWIIQSLLAFAFLIAGGLKLAKNKEALIKDPKMGWAADFSTSQIKLIGLTEVVGAVGVILPLALGIFPILTPLAAVGLSITMFGAIATHLRRKEKATPAIALAIMSLIVAIGRFYFR